jgi:hypothetical protein
LVGVTTGEKICLRLPFLTGPTVDSIILSR